MVYDATAATAAAQAAQAARSASAEATHRWYTQQCKLMGESPRFSAEYQRRAQVLDGAYEAAVEPHRQAFLSDYPSQSLPPFMEPGFKAFAAQLPQITPEPEVRPEAVVMPLTPVQAFDDATAERNASAAASLAWHRQQPQRSQPERAYLQAGYVDRLRAIDARFEQMMEPYRQEFSTDHPGQPLPPFMERGYQAITPGSLANLPSVSTMKRPEAPEMLAGYPMRTWKTAGVLGVVGVILIAMISSCDTSPKAKTTPPATLTSCEIAMRTASQEPDSTLADPLILHTREACGSKAEWIAAVKKFPAAMGAMDFTDATAGQSWELVCYDSPSSPACRG